jgi:hypothetical protein
MTMHTEGRLTNRISKLVDTIGAGQRRRDRARHARAAGRLVRTGLETIALVSLARHAGGSRHRRAAALVAGAYLTHAGRRRH